MSQTPEESREDSRLKHPAVPEAETLSPDRPARTIEQAGAGALARLTPEEPEPASPEPASPEPPRGDDAIDVEFTVQESPTPQERFAANEAQDAIDLRVTEAAISFLLDTHTEDDVLVRYADGAATPAERAWIDAHTRRCPACAAELDVVRSLVAGIRRG